MVEGIPKDVIDHTLECCRCIAESDRHDSVFEKAVSAMKSRLPFVPWLDPNEMVAVLEIDFIEVFRFSNSFLELIHVREGVAVWDGDFVDCSVVNAQA